MLEDDVEQLAGADLPGGLLEKLRGVKATDVPEEYEETLRNKAESLGRKEDEYLEEWAKERVIVEYNARRMGLERVDEVPAGSKGFLMAWTVGGTLAVLDAQRDGQGYRDMVVLRKMSEGNKRVDKIAEVMKRGNVIGDVKVGNRMDLMDESDEWMNTSIVADLYEAKEVEKGGEGDDKVGVESVAVELPNATTISGKVGAMFRSARSLFGD